MGNSVFKSNCDTSFVLDHDEPGVFRSIVAGNHLRGKLIVKVKKSLPPTSIVLRLTGKEKTWVYRRMGKSGKMYRCDRSVCMASVKLLELGTAEIMPGTMVFPFDFALPGSIPTSMQCAERRSSCTIVYKLKVDATSAGRVTSRAVAERVFTVAAAPLPNIRVPAVIPPKSHKVNSMGLSRGSIAIAARVVDVQVGRQSNLDVYLACRNDATASVYRVEVTLIEQTQWQADERWASSTRTVAIVNDVEIPGMVRQKQDTQIVRDQLRRGGVRESEVQDLYGELQDDQNWFCFRVPAICRDSYVGTTIRISHMLKITLYTKSMVSNPFIQIPVQIGFPPVAGAQDNTPPQPEPAPAALPVPAATPAVPIAVPLPMQTGSGADPPAPIAGTPMAQAQPYRPGLPTQLSVANVPEVDIPIVSAVAIPLDDNAIQSPPVSAPPEAMVVGGLVNNYASYEVSEEEGQWNPPPGGSDLQTSATTPTAPFMDVTSPTLASLLEEMAFSINDRTIIFEKLQDSSWRRLLADITPDEYGSILAHVHVDSQQPHIAEMLAQVIRSQFTCQHAREGAKNAADWNRATVVQRILPFCMDIVTDHSVILEVLSEWERTVTQNDFDTCIARRR